MAKIPTFNPLSGEARSPLIAGLTEVANKISDALNMQSEEFENVILSEVFITDSDRYRIYEVDMGKKLWLSEPNPIIRKNGSIINSAVDNFTVDLIGGSIAFEPTNRLLETDILTATFTSVKAESKKLYDIQQTLIEIQTKLAKDKGYYESPTELRVAYPTATDGDFAVVGTTDTMWVWDNDTTDWKDTHKITDLTNYYDKSVIDNLLSQKEPTLNAKGTDTVDDNFYYGGRKQWIDLFAKVRNTILTGIDLTAQGKVEEIDNVIIALGKLQSQINSSNIAVEDLSNVKVDKIDGKGLSTNDLTNELKTKYDNYNTTKEPTITTKNTAFNKNFGTTAGTVAEGDKVYSKEESNSLFVRNKIYGIKIDKNNSDPATRVSYTDDASDMLSCFMDYSTNTFNYGSWKNFIEELATPVMLNYDGTEAYELDRNDQTKKADGTPSDVSDINFNGNAMVRLKKIYVKIYDDSNYHYIKFSFSQIDNSYKAYAYINQNGITQYSAYMPMFRGSFDSIGRLRSIAGQTPIGNKTGQEEIDAVNKNGNGYYTQYWSVWNLKALLLCFIGKTTDTQLTFGQGNSEGNSAPLQTGTLVNQGAFFGYSDTTHQVKCFYSEVMWGDQRDRLMGCIIGISGNMKIKNSPPYNSTGDGYTTVKTISTNTSGFLKHANITDDGCIATDLSGSDNTYFCDKQYLYTSSTNPYYAAVGGDWCFGSYCGAFYLRCDSLFSYSSSSFGASPFYIAP